MNEQLKFVVKSKQTKDDSIYYIVDEKGNKIKELDDSKYIICFTEDVLGYFAVFAMKDKSGWIAIDFNENILFKVYNTSYGEPSPDEIIDNKIRIVDDNNKIGFADYKGNIIIKPQFEMVTSFHNSKAIISENCDKIPWDKHAKENDCHHFSIVCKKNGYINEKGKIQELGNFTFEEIESKIKWKAP